MSSSPAPVVGAASRLNRSLSCCSAASRRIVSRNGGPAGPASGLGRVSRAHRKWTATRRAIPQPARHEKRPTMGLPPPQGLYDPRNEHDACGVGFVANIKGRKSHEIIGRGLEILVNLDHRG